jgi:hypothetical protein
VWVHGDLVLGGISDQTLSIGEGNKGGSGSIALIVGNDFDTIITEDTHTGVGGSKIDTDRRSTCWSHDEVLIKKKY